MKSNPIMMLAAAALTVAVLSTLLVKGAWLIWIPILLALAVFAYVVGKVSR